MEEPLNTIQDPHDDPVNISISVGQKQSAQRKCELLVLHISRNQTDFCMVLPLLQKDVQAGYHAPCRDFCCMPRGKGLWLGHENRSL